MKTISSFIHTLAMAIISGLLLMQCTKTNDALILDIPDTAFLSALIDNGVDKNNDGIIDQDEAEQTCKLLLTEMPEFSLAFASTKLFYLKSTEQINLYLEGLKKSGVPATVA